MIAPEHRLELIRESASNTKCVRSKELHWLKWKDNLQEFFKIPSSLNVYRQHMFLFRAENAIPVFVKVLTEYAAAKSFNLFNSSNSAQPAVHLIDTRLKDRAL